MNVIEEDVTDGMVNINLNAAGIPLDLPQLPLCDALNYIGVQCPLKKGIGKFDVTEFIPEAPTVSHHMKTKCLLLFFKTLYIGNIQWISYCQ